MTSLPIDLIAARLAVAIVAGALLGLNRNLRHKPAGLRTHALVSLGAATATLIATSMSGADALARIVAGILTGIGFLGAGVIVRRDDSTHAVSGLTTAASIWVAGMLGTAAGAGLFELLVLAFGGTMLVLVVGGPLERAVLRATNREPETPAPAARRESR